MAAALGGDRGGFGDGLSSYVYLSAVAGVLLLALDRVLQYFWRATADA